MEEKILAIQKDAQYTRENILTIKKKTEDSNSKILSILNEMDLKMPMSEGRRIYEEFRKYATYKDLKELHNRVIPEISKFEDKLLKFLTEMEKFKLIIAKFDEHLLTKASKESVSAVKSYVDDEFTRKQDTDKNLKEHDQQRQALSSRIDDLDKLLKYQAKQI